MGQCLSSTAESAASNTLAISSRISQKAAPAKPEDAVNHVNHALVFIKPHAVGEPVEQLVLSNLKAKKVRVLERGELTHTDLEKIIDEHYSTLALNAMVIAPKELLTAVPAEQIEEFKTTYGESTEEAVAAGKLVNIKELMDRFPNAKGVTASAIDAAWKAAGDDVRIKLMPGTYVSRVTIIDDDAKEHELYLINGFYAAMREKYVRKGAKVVYFSVEWDEKDLSWKNFRGQVIGATNPSVAHPESIRSKLFEQHAALGLTSQPNIGDNGCHASAGPIEGLKERMTWLNADLYKDEFGKKLLDAGVSFDHVHSWANNGHILVKGQAYNAFDVLEDLNSSEVVDLALKATTKEMK